MTARFRSPTRFGAQARSLALLAPILALAAAPAPASAQDRLGIPVPTLDLLEPPPATRPTPAPAEPAPAPLPPANNLDAVERALSSRPGSATPRPAPGPAGPVVLQGSHRRFVFDREIVRVAVGDPDVVGVEVVSSREVLALGRRVGRTSFIVWFADGSTSQEVLSVRRDLSVLAAALEDIWPDIAVESAPDRDAVVLRGVVPDLAYRRAAEQTARDYLSAGAQGGSRGDGQPLVQAGERIDADGSEQATLRVSAGRQLSRAAVINLIRVEDLPATTEERLERALFPIGGQRVTVRRVQRGDLPDDDADSFVLEGSVADQVVLTRLLAVAAQVVTGDPRAASSIRVLGNEAGGLGTGGRGAGAGGGGGGGGGSTIGSLLGTSAGFGGVASRTGQGLGNDLAANVGRASALSVAGGRILAFLDVRDLPLVRIEARLYEVNRTAMKEWTPEVSVVAGDVPQAALLPTLTGLGTQGLGATRVGGGSRTEFQQALSLLGGAFLTQPQIAGPKFVVDTLLSLLEEEGIARSLSQPNLTVLSGETASFQVGGEIPVPVAVQTNATSADGALLNSVVFVPFGVSVGVRPLVGEQDWITLDVIPEITEPDPNLTAAIRDTTGTDQATTAFSTRTLRTSTRLQDGQAVVLAGLLRRRASERNAYTPWLSEVPVLGWFARRFDETRDELELVVVLSPTLVRKPVPGLPLWAFPSTSVPPGPPGAGPLPRTTTAPVATGGPVLDPSAVAPPQPRP